MSDTQQIARQDPIALAQAAAGDLYTRQQVNLLKQMIMPRGSDAELAFFIEYVKQTRLDPFARQIYAIPKFKDGKPAGYDFMTGIDGLRVVAERTGEYQGSEIAWCGKDGKWVDVWTDDDHAPYAARATVHRLGRRPTSRVVKFREFVKRDRQGKIQAGPWSTMPAHQLGVRADAHALRAAFPREMAGVSVNYDDDRDFHIVNPDAPASNAQKGELMRLARLFGWDDEERHRRAGVGSFKDLTKGQANVLIDEWRRMEMELVEDGVVPDDIEDGELVEDVEAAHDKGGSPAVDAAAQAAGPVSPVASADPNGDGTGQPSAPSPGTQSAEGRVGPDADKAKRKSARSGEVSRGTAKPPASPPASEPVVEGVAGSEVAGHAFEGNPDDDEPCVVCNQPFGNRVHHATQGTLG